MVGNACGFEVCKSLHRLNKLMSLYQPRREMAECTHDQWKKQIDDVEIPVLMIHWPSSLTLMH